MSGTTRIPVAVLGGSGYVAGELVRLLVGHPRFALTAVASTSQVGEPVTSAFPHLRGTAADALVFEAPDALASRFAPDAPFGLLAATPHGATAALLDALLGEAEARRAHVRAVDLSADFRFQQASEYEAIYGQPHGAPARLPEFTCGVPEHVRGKPAAHATQPGCFTTAVVLAAYPFVAAGLVDDEIFVAAVTGSSGSGRKLASGTHHPERRSNLYAYSPLTHRHEPEMRALVAGAARLATEPEIAFVPHAGPFARGIHATISTNLARPTTLEEIRSFVSSFYGGLSSSFVRVLDAPPHLQNVVGTNRCDLSFAIRGSQLIAFSVLDNLVKGAAGGGVQWMNRLFALPESTGLLLPGLGWL